MSFLVGAVTNAFYAADRTLTGGYLARAAQAAYQCGRAAGVNPKVALCWGLVMGASLAMAVVYASAYRNECPQCPQCSQYRITTTHLRIDEPIEVILRKTAVIDGKIGCNIKVLDCDTLSCNAVYSMNMDEPCSSVWKLKLG